MQDFNEILINATNMQKKPAPTEAWPFIAEALRKRKKRRIMWFFLSFLIMVLLGVGTFFFKNNGKADKIIAKNNTSNKKNNLNNIDDFNEKESTQNLSKINIDTVNKNNKNIKKDTLILLISTKKNEEIFERNLISKNTKSRFKVNIKAPLVITDNKKEILDTKVIKKEIESYTNENTIAKTNNDKKIINDTTNSISLKIDTILDKTVKAKTVTEKEIEKNENKKLNIKIRCNNKWKPYVGISYGALFVRNKNLFNNENKNALTNNAQTYTASLTLRSDINNEPNYYTGKQISLSFLFKKENKKFQPILGINLTLGNFNTTAYAATSAALNTNTFIVDSTQTGNSLYASKNTFGANQLNIKNNFIQLGLLFGCNIPLFTFNNESKISFQMQVVPSYNLSQSIQWFDKLSTRYFTSNILMNNFNITQSTALLWETNIKERVISVGPYFNFNYLKINKDVTNVSNIFFQSFGAQINLKLKK